MLLLPGLSPSPDAGEALVRAANIAGAATLLIEADDAAARQYVRSGMCDFLVNNLNEALRILKNELRLKQSAAVCLLAEPASALGDCIERGVQPELCAPRQQDATSPAVLTLQHRGATLLSSFDDRGSLTQADFAWASWSAATQSARTLPLLDRLALAALEPGVRVERQRWVLRSPQYVSLGGRSRGPVARRAGGVVHMLPMREQEAAAFARSVSLAIIEGRLPESLILAYGTEPLVALPALAADHPEEAAPQTVIR